MMIDAFVLFVQAMAAYFIGTIVFDIVHYLLHRFLESKSKWLRTIGSFHLSHHRFYTSDLKIQNQWSKQNLIHHVSTEYIVQIIAIFCCAWFLNIYAVIAAAVFVTSIFLFVCYKRGNDPHHKVYDILPPYRGGLICKCGVSCYASFTSN